jgi:hypothetical protein
MRELSERLLSLIDSAEPKLRAVADAESVKPVLRGGWSRKRVIGQIDSASNNHQRFVRASLQSSLEFPAYD